MRTREDLKPSSTVNTIIEFIIRAIRTFLPTMVSAFVRCAVQNKINLGQLPDSDVRFSDFFAINLSGGIGMRKEQFLQTAECIDFYYAVTYSPDPKRCPLTPLTLVTLALTNAKVGANLMHLDGVLKNSDVIGSKVLNFTNSSYTQTDYDNMRSDTRGTGLKVIGFTQSDTSFDLGSLIFSEDGNLFSQTTTSQTIPTVQLDKQLPRTTTSDDDEEVLSH